MTTTSTRLNQIRAWVRENIDPAEIAAPAHNVPGTYRIPFYPVANGRKVTVQVPLEWDGTCWSWA